jgi:hypothetical protein
LTGPFVLDIAGIRFSISAPPGTTVGLDDPRYVPFFGASAGPATVEVPVELRLDDGPDLDESRLIFESEGPWRVFRDGGDLLIELRPGGPGTRLEWLARVAPAVASVLVHCGSEPPPGGRLPSPIHYPLDQLLMMCLLPHLGGLLVHAAGVRRGPGALIFPGRSGAGKSTTMSLLAGYPGLEGLSDDRIVVREVGGRYRAFGTPWAGDQPVVSHDDAELRGIAFLHQAPETSLVPISPRRALDQLLRTASIPWFDAETVSPALGACDALLSRVPLYELHFRKHAEIGDVVASLF